MFEISAAIIFTALSNANLISKYDVFMPSVVPDMDEIYLCTTARLNLTSFYIVGFEPKASKRTVHHILLYGCKIPGSSNAAWECGEMASEGGTSGSPCADESQVIYAWGLDALELILPEDVGFKVGGDSPSRYLVLQVHYKHKFKKYKTDRSGVTLYYRNEKVPKTAGVLVLGTGGVLKPHSEVHMETACVIEEDTVLHPFAFRTHTHKLGYAVAGWKVVERSGKHDWELIGKRNPQDPQMFYPVEDPSIVIRKGDIVAARCSMYNYRKQTVPVGPKSNDEMCNFYIMYWTYNGKPLKTNYCFSGGPPNYFWETGQPFLSNIPQKESEFKKRQRQTKLPRRLIKIRSMASRGKGGNSPKLKLYFYSLMLSFWVFRGATLS